jgi:hypothetical protein
MSVQSTIIDNQRILTKANERGHPPSFLEAIASYDGWT